MKKKSILSALEGGHLDASLFGSQVTKVNEGDKDAQDEPSRFSRRNRFGGRGKGAAASRGKTGRKTRSDTGI